MNTVPTTINVDLVDTLMVAGEVASWGKHNNNNNDNNNNVNDNNNNINITVENSLLQWEICLVGAVCRKGKCFMNIVIPSVRDSQLSQSCIFIVLTPRNLSVNITKHNSTPQDTTAIYGNTLVCVCASNVELLYTTNIKEVSCCHVGMPQWSSVGQPQPLQGTNHRVIIILTKKDFLIINRPSSLHHSHNVTGRRSHEVCRGTLLQCL